MAETTAIAWTDHTFNPWMGCHKVSAGCKHCYAEEMTQNGKMKKLNIGWGLNAPRRRTGKAVWARPFTWNREAEHRGIPARVFCASLADVFEDEPQPNEWRPDVFEVIRKTPWLDYQLLTKRPENLGRMLPDDWGDGWPNVWLGTSIEQNDVAERASWLTAVPAHVHFVSYEPAIGPLDELDLIDLEWMIVGGESGPGHRKMDLDWAREMQDRCRLYDVAYFFKQNHGYRTELGIDALGAVYRDYPDSADRPVPPEVPADQLAV